VSRDMGPRLRLRHRPSIPHQFAMNILHWLLRLLAYTKYGYRRLIFRSALRALSKQAKNQTA
jgi:hypothetical protein